MLAGLLVFIWGKPLLQGAGESPNPDLLAKKRLLGLTTEWWIYICTFIATLFIWWVVRDQDTVNVLLSITGLLTVGYIVYRSVLTLKPHARNRILTALFLISIQVLFWGLFEQAGSSLSLYTDDHVNRNIFGQEVVTSVFQTFNAMYIVFLGPVFSALWIWLAKRGLEPSTPAKFGLGVIQLGLGFLVLVWGAQASGSNLTPVIFIFLIYLLHTCLLYTSPSPRDQRGSRMPSSA